MMKKRYLLIIMSTLLATGYFAGQRTVTQADGINQAGSAEDPLVTKSYVDQILKGHVPSGTGSSATVPSMDDISKYIASELDKRMQSLPSPTPNVPSPSAPAAITVVNLKPNQTLFAGEGAEFIVRTGKVTVVSTDGNGVPDVTAGKDLPAGTVVELNHLLVFPREGRGIKPDPKTTGDTYVMIRGNYLLVDGDK
jgi:hypothetical protein